MKHDSEEWKDWCEVYEYMKKDILGYTEDMKLPGYMVLRLQGLRKGKFMANKAQVSLANYEYKTILITLKINKLTIQNYIKRNEAKFKNEQHKFNGIMIIIEGDINNTVLIQKKAERSKTQAEGLELKHQITKSADYNKTEEKRKNNKLDKLW